MNLAPVVELVGRRIGLDPESLGANVFPSAAAEHMRALGMSDSATYAATLAQDPSRFQELMERLVVRETWFFRGAELFAALPALLAERSTQRPVRLLSLPCSTGEEPYSLALALLEAGLSAERWRLEAIDLSLAALDKARRGVYREFSFRQTPAVLRHKYFRQTGEEWELDPAVRRLVTFSVGNVLDEGSIGSEPYDLILCRNLLIYLTPEARGRTLANLQGWLAADGLLALGHAEPQIVAGRDFERVGAEACFLFRRRATAERSPAPAIPRLAVMSRPRSPVVKPVRAAALSPPEPVVVRAAAPRDATLDQARRLADANRLDEALAECKTQLAAAGPSAAAYSLLGVVHQARGDLEEAGEAFRKALYLDPAHQEALTHAMLLAAQRGDTDRAAVLRERLARVKSKGDS